MKIVQINATCGVGSTGKISVGISKILSESTIENYILYSSKSNGYPLGIQCSDDWYIKFQALKSRIFGDYGFNSKKTTRKIITELERIKPDVVHLHNIHGHDCNLEMLFTYYKKNKIKLIWSFHDCWAFTGYCTYYDVIGCNKWKSCCKDCPQYKAYGWFWDRSHTMFERKKELLGGLDLTVVTPSQWLAKQVKESFLKGYEVKVINNGIDLNVFKTSRSEFRKKYDCQDRFIILGVAFGWENRKGLDIFVELSKRLNEKYQIVLVGTDHKVDSQLPSNIISIHRTQNQQELAEIYTAADVFVNPTREDNYPTVNMESLACGTPVITFNAGGSPEIIDMTCGSIVDKDDINSMEKEIIRVCETRPYSAEACLKRAEAFDMNKRFQEYVDLYRSFL